MLMSVALVVCQVSVTAWPGWTVSGLALNDAVGAAGGGGGGGGVGATFLWQALNSMAAPSANANGILFKVSCFTFSSQTNKVLWRYTDRSNFPAACTNEKIKSPYEITSNSNLVPNCVLP
jgi:hypothetical protein